jgi:O-antigen ligase
VLLHGILKLEPLLLGLLTVAMWFPSPTRDHYVWVFLFFIPLLIVRWIVRGHIVTMTKLDGVLVAFFVLGILNLYLAPYTRGFIMLARPLFGLLLYFAIVEAARQQKCSDQSINYITVLAVVIAILAIFGTQWNEKSFQFEGIVNALPTLESLTFLKEAGLSFNANEIAGAIAYVLPVMAGIAAYRWRMKLPRVGVTLAFVVLFISLFLGQSRLTIIGVLLTLAIIIFTLIPRGRWQLFAWGALAIVTILELTLIFNPVSRQELGERDEDSLSGRFNIWSSALSIVHDYPYTGVGLNMFRDRRVLERYPVPRWYPSPGATRILPHTHNELLQAATDMGIPGIVVFIGMYLVALYMLIQTWQHGDHYAKAVSVSAAMGLLAHAIFGVGDAITFWDRFAFLFWGVLGLLRAQYLLTTRFNENL